VWWVAAIGMAMSAIGQFKQGQSEADQEEQNTAYYLQQAAYARASSQRQEQLAYFDYSNKQSQQGSHYAAGNVELSGSAAITMGGTLSQMTKEIWAIQEKGKLENDLATMRAQGANDRANALRDPMNQILNIGGGMLGKYSQARSSGLFNGSDSPSASASEKAGRTA
jgi:hypothetical protein